MLDGGFPFSFLLSLLWSNNIRCDSLKSIVVSPGSSPFFDIHQEVRLALNSRREDFTLLNFSIELPFRQSLQSDEEYTIGN